MGNNVHKRQDVEMTFIEHLEELRWHLIRSILAIAIIGIAAFIFKGIVFDGILLAPTRSNFFTYRILCQLSNKFNLGDELCFGDLKFSLKNIIMAGQFTQHLTTSLFAGFIVAFPYVFWEFWRFLKPALNRTEQKMAGGIVFFSALLFFMGVLFGYYVLLPVTVQFLGNYQVSELVQNEINLGSYLGTLTGVIMATAIIFELPIVVYFLSKVGLITPAMMRQHRKHALVVILIFSAVLTPPDMTSQLLLTIPFYVLYEGSIWISATVYRNQLKQQKFR